MKTINITVNNKHFEFICNSRNTSSGFAHDCYLLVDGIERTISHCYYINRTWERYQYESVCNAAISNLISEYIQDNKTAFKALYNYKKLTAKRAADFMEHLKNCEQYNTLITCKNQLLSRMF